MFTYAGGMAQALLFGHEPVAVDRSFAFCRRVELGRGAWLEHQPGWLSGHVQVFGALRDGMRWRAQRRRMYEREVDVPRLVSSWPSAGAGHPIVADCVTVLSERYARDLGAVSFAYYRDGADSVAPHADRMGSLTDDCVIAIVAVGERRRFLLRAGDPDGPSHSFDLGWGDLLVMGGACQRYFRHGIPKSRQPVGPRISMQLRQARS